MNFVFTRFCFIISFFIMKHSIENDEIIYPLYMCPWAYDLGIAQ